MSRMAARRSGSWRASRRSAAAGRSWRMASAGMVDLPHSSYHATTHPGSPRSDLGEPVLSPQQRLYEPHHPWLVASGQLGRERSCVTYRSRRRRQPRRQSSLYSSMIRRSSSAMGSSRRFASTRKCSACGLVSLREMRFKFCPSFGDAVWILLHPKAPPALQHQNEARGQLFSPVQFDTCLGDGFCLENEEVERCG